MEEEIHRRWHPSSLGSRKMYTYRILCKTTIWSIQT